MPVITVLTILVVDAGFRYGRSIPLRNLHQTDFSAYQNCAHKSGSRAAWHYTNPSMLYE